MDTKDTFVIVTILILLVKTKKAIFKVSYKTILSRGRSWSRSRNLDLRLRRAERNHFGYTTMAIIYRWCR